MFECQTTTLNNGLRIVHCHANNNVSYCGFMVDCGTRHEAGPSEFGMAHFVEHILFKGTTSRDSWHINNRMESVGGELNAFTTKEDTTFYSVFQPKDFNRACELLCDLICNATAPQHELEKEQEVVIEEIESYRDTPSELIYDEFENMLFEGQDLGHNILGTAESVRSFDSRKCLNFITRNYIPSRMVFFSYGPTPWKYVVRQIEKYFHPRCQAVVNSVQVGQQTNEISAPLPSNLHQAHCVIGCKSFAIGHPDAAALALLNNILGGPGMNSRLNLELREHRGLVYTVESNLTNYTDTGYFSIYFGSDHADYERCQQLCLKQLQKLSETQLSSRQLLAAQKQLKGQLAIATANLENNAIAMAKNMLRLGRVESLEQTCQRIDAVTTQQILRVAQQLFSPERLSTVVLK